MTNVQLGFKAFDIHELLTHFVAERGGFYQQQGLEVGLIDSTFIPDEQLPPRTFSAACGAALVGYLNGAPNKVVLVNTDSPMFWLYSCEGLSSIEQLAGKRIASYPGLAPPAHFLSFLTKGMDVQLLPVSTDAARLGLLQSGDVDVALISSALPPAVMESKGFEEPLQTGEVLRVPTTGLAISKALLQEEPELVTRMVKAQLKSLSELAENDQLLSEVLTNGFGLPVSAVEPTSALVRKLFTKNGCSNADIEQTALTKLSSHLGLEQKQDDSLYDYSILNS